MNPASEDKPTCAEDIDHVICAKLPDIDTHPLAFETIIRHMIHSPCSTGIPYAPCMDGGICRKKILRSFVMIPLLTKMVLSDIDAGMMVEV